MNIITMQKELEEIVSKHQDLIGTEAKNLQQEYAIGTAKATKEAIEKINGENRLLQIGILGRVKAGKSSLINALLFDGKSILPKAATPMTAALTIISYGEELSAEVEFFKQKDIENIKSEAKKYESEFEKLKNNALKELKERKAKKEKKQNFLDKVKDKAKEILELKELNEKAEKKAKREIKNNMSLISSYDQWQRIEASNVNYTQLPVFETVTSDSLENLSNALLDYVGSDGQYMPFTKSVHIKIPQENLKGIQIVDTPGVNDPVQSREERTRELLKFCDVVFIVSPSGQFMSSEDLDLMDRITSKEGIRELYVIASQSDLQLFGSVKEESNGELHKAFTHITDGLAKHLHSTLTQLKENNQEVGTAYDSLIEESSKKVIHSSGICLTIKESFNKRELWDEGVKTAWNNLTKHYPDYFSDSDKTLSISNLDLLANISTINSIVDDVKNKKDSILEARKEEFIEAKINALTKYKKGILDYISTRTNDINNGSIEELKSEQKKLKKIKEDVSDIVDEEYYEIVDTLEINIKNELNARLKSYFRDAKDSISDAEGSETESYEVSDSSWYNPFSYGRTKTKSRTFTTARTGAIRSALENLTWEIEDSIDTTAKLFILEWKKMLNRDLVRVLRDNVNDEDLNVTQIKKVIRNVLTQIKYPEISYSGQLPSSLSASGTLKDSRAETYIDDAQEYVSSLNGRVKNDIKNFLIELIEALRGIQMAKSIFGNYDELLKELEEQVNNREITLDKLKRIKNEIEKVA
jgi:predicted GTPase